MVVRIIGAGLAGSEAASLAHTHVIELTDVAQEVSYYVAGG
jgi:folate-dependent tRNA-U54 methylase TrmFO/GidA